MAIRIREIAGSEEGFEGLTSAERSIVMRVWDPSDNNPTVADMYAAVAAYVPATVGVLSLDKIAWDYDEQGNSWVFTASYNFRPPEETLRWGFDTQGGSIRVTHALATNAFVASGTAPNFNGGIGYSNGELQGVDKVIPALKLNCTYRWPANAVTTSYVNTLASLSGTVNAGTFGTYAAGELLFLGASGEIVPGKPTEINYQFAASANATGLSIGSISSIAKKGHEYLWVLWEDDEDATAKRLVKKPLAAYVQRVYAEVDFSALGII